MSFVSRTSGVLSFDIKPDEELSKKVLIFLCDFFRRMVGEFDNRFNLGYKEEILKGEDNFAKFMQKQ
jgi:hypothetical protein